MYNIGIRINHGTFHGINMTTNHNFICHRPFNLKEKIVLDSWGGVTGEVYQCSNRFRPIESTDIILNK